MPKPSKPEEPPRRRGRAWMLVVAALVVFGVGLWLYSRLAESPSQSDEPSSESGYSLGSFAPADAGTFTATAAKGRALPASFAGAQGYFIKRVDGGADAGGDAGSDAGLSDDELDAGAVSEARSNLPPSAFALAALSGQVGTLQGTVTTTRTFPNVTSRSMSSDVWCANHGKAPTVLSADVHDGGVVANAVVRLDTPDFPTPLEPFSLREKGCELEPSVQGALAGQRILVANLDGALHDLSASEGGTKLFTPFAQVPGSPPVERPFPSWKGIVFVRCVVHPWEHAYVVVTNNPFFAVTDAQGHYRIDGIPAGLYVTHVWHPLVSGPRDAAPRDEAFRVYPGQVTEGDMAL